MNIAVYGFVAWLPTFFVKEGRDVVTSLGFTTLMSFGAPVGAVLGFLCADRLGRAKGLVSSAIATIVLGFVYPQMVANAAIACVGFMLVTCIYAIVTLGLFSYVPELFPTALRLRGTGTAGVCGRLASMTTSYVAVLLYPAVRRVRRAWHGVLGADPAGGRDSLARCRRQSVFTRSGLAGG